MVMAQLVIKQRVGFAANCLTENLGRCHAALQKVNHTAIGGGG
jgi:hypothetical protein